MKASKMLFVWAVAVLATTSLTYFGLAMAEGAVSDRPLTPAFVARETTVNPDYQDPSSTTTITEARTTTAPTSVPPLTTPTTLPESSATTTTTTTLSTGPSSTLGGQDWRQETVLSVGGTVVFRWRPREIEFVSASPASGFAYVVEEAGPREVRVRFSGTNLEILVTVTWRNGGPEVRII